MAPTRFASLIEKGTRSIVKMPASRKAKSASSVSGGCIPIKPEGEGHQAPDLPAQILASRAVRVQQGTHRRRIEAALAVQGLLREDVPRERLQRTSQPGRQRYREPLLAAMDDLPREQWRQRPPQEALLGETPNLEAVRQGEGKVRDPLIEQGNPQLERVRHAQPVRLDQ